MLKAAIFDMDGLLIDSERIIMQACITACKEVGIDYDQSQFVELIGRSPVDASRIMTKQLGGARHMAAVSERVGQLLAARDNVFPLKTGVLAILQYYQSQGIHCGVASSSPLHHIEHRLNHVNVLDYFSTITSGQEVANGKPAPDIYLLAMQKLNVTADACIAFEDSEQGARAAIAAGLKTVVVPDLKPPSDYVRENSFQVTNSLQSFVDTQAQKR